MTDPSPESVAALAEALHNDETTRPDALAAAERMYLAIGAVTAGDRSLSEDYILAYVELGDALRALATPEPRVGYHDGREHCRHCQSIRSCRFNGGCPECGTAASILAALSRDGWVLERKELREAARYVVQLGNQPGMDDDEWEQAMTMLEQALNPCGAMLGQGPATCGLPSGHDGYHEWIARTPKSPLIEMLATPCPNCHHPLGSCASGVHFDEFGRPCFCESGLAAALAAAHAEAYRENTDVFAKIEKARRSVNGSAGATDGDTEAHRA